mmetsp:Transcript_105542/g.181932  ORF Transcript_105542/g.181932 Transcript_105542/m.181932 type:complete len:295 (+) Transcript_105542:573-1457(+)
MPRECWVTLGELRANHAEVVKHRMLGRAVIRWTHQGQMAVSLLQKAFDGLEGWVGQQRERGPTVDKHVAKVAGAADHWPTTYLEDHSFHTIIALLGDRRPMDCPVEEPFVIASDGQGPVFTLWPGSDVHCKHILQPMLGNHKTDGAGLLGRRNAVVRQPKDPVNAHLREHGVGLRCIHQPYIEDCRHLRFPIDVHGDHFLQHLAAELGPVSVRDPERTIRIPRAQRCSTRRTEVEAVVAIPMAGRTAAGGDDEVRAPRVHLHSHRSGGCTYPHDCIDHCGDPFKLGLPKPRGRM